LKDFIEKNEITDVLIFHNSFSANTSSHADQLRQILNSKTVCVAHKLPEWEVMFPEGKLMESVLDKQKREVSKDSSGTSNKKTENKKNKKNTVVKKQEPENKPEPEKKEDSTVVNGQ
jgi:ribosomal protein L12E/L44/L45/RPP1/RPP2